MNPLLLTDFYKIGHYLQYPAGTEVVYSNLTARKSRLENVKETIFFGLQAFMLEYLIERFDRDFFNRPKEEVIDEYRRIIKNTIGDLPDYEHIEYLHDLGYLPLLIKAVPEGTHVPIGVPMLTLRNTDPKCYWLTNFVESLLSAQLWLPITSATHANKYRELFNEVLDASIDDTSFVDFMGHDFSFRGMEGLEGSYLSGLGHLTSFAGTDTIPAILAAEKYYGADVEKELVGTSVSATEHSVMSSGTAIHGEFETFRQLVTEIYPTGIVSIVSDTFDLWAVLTDFMPRLKDEILARDGGPESLDKVVIRPDSGDPVDIICGKPPERTGTTDLHTLNKTGPEYKGVVELLWDTFGGEVVNGFKVLNPAVGAIYGDSITLERAEQISERLMAKGFAPIIVYGIGSFTYQYNTRDTFGMAVKCTAIEHNGKLVDVFKDPITDDGTKKSLKGLIEVSRDMYGNIRATDECTWEQENEGMLETVFFNGVLTRRTTLAEIRERVKGAALETV